MTEKSYFWDEMETGDAEEAPYTSTAMQNVLRILFAANEAEYAQIEGYINDSGATPETNSPDFRHFLESSKSRLDVGNAVAYGSPYQLDEDAQIGYSYTGVPRYYTVVLRHAVAAQTARLVTLGPQVGSYPTPVWNSQYHDVPIRRGIISTEGVSNHFATTRKMFAMNNIGLLSQRYRLGGSSTHWNTYGVTAYPITVSQKIQAGYLDFTDLTCCPVGSAHYDHDIVFPHPFTYNPIVLCRLQYLNDITSLFAVKLLVDAVSTTGFTIHWRSMLANYYTNIRFSWIAIGHIAKG